MEIKGICPIAPAVYNANGEVDCQEYESCCSERFPICCALYGDMHTGVFRSVNVLFFAIPCSVPPHKAA